MLVLTRRREESVLVRDEVTGELLKIKVVRMKGSQVQLGFEASSRYKIFRDELDELPGKVEVPA